MTFQLFREVYIHLASEFERDSAVFLASNPFGNNGISIWEEENAWRNAEAESASIESSYEVSFQLSKKRCNRDLSEPVFGDEIMPFALELPGSVFLLEYIDAGALA